MIAAVALRYAGPGAHLAARPTGVTHVYVGPLTRSGKSLPRASRPVCRAHTRRLTVVTYSDRVGLHRVCARCAACLVTDRARRAALRTRRQYRTRFAGLTGRQLVAALEDARTTVEVDQVAHLTLVLFDHTGCRRPDPATGRSLHDHVTAARARFQTASVIGADFHTHAAEVSARRRAEWQALRAGRDARIARVGIRNVAP